MSFRTPPQRGRDKTPSWVVFLLGAALVFGLYYIGIGIRDYLRTGGLGVVEATQRADIINTATAVQVESREGTATPIPTFTPIPACTDFTVIVPSAVVRQTPSTDAPPVAQYSLGTIVCVLGRAPGNAEWYLIDTNPRTRRIDEAYMREDLIEALNPTPTPTMTFTPPPTVTSTLTPTATDTALPLPTATLDRNATTTPTLTETPTPTAPFESA
jgi:hypothetical protein